MSTAPSAPRPPGANPAVLRGRDHTELGDVAAVAIDRGLAVAISRGRHLKQYAYTDPNEDVVAAVRDGGTAALVVADGHSGTTASHVGVDAVLQALGSPPAVWDRRTAVHAFHDVNEHIRAHRRQGDRPGARTTLAVAVVTTGGDGQRHLTHASVGDSAVVVVRDGVAHAVSRDRHHFLGDRLSAPQVAGAMDHGLTDLAPDDVVFVVSDGYTGFADTAHLPTALGGDAADVASRVIDLAGDAGAGDNVAVAVLLPTAG